MYNYTYHKWCATLAAYIAGATPVAYTAGATAKRNEAIQFLTSKTNSHVQLVQPV